jgi:16S rRNA (cytosine967-C5)-methyltransferase
MKPFKKISARDLALKILLRVEKEQAFAAAVLEAELRRAKDTREASLANELVLGVLRNRLWLNHLLNLASARGLKKTAPAVLTILQIGAYQLIYSNKIPSRAAVSEAVNQTKKSDTPHLSGMVNAILRHITRMDPEVIKPPECSIESSLDEISVSYSFPVWLVKKLTDGRGKKESLAIIKSLNRPATRFMRININRISVDKALELAGKGSSGSKLLSWSVTVPDKDIAKKMESQGIAAFQDDGAGLVVLALNPAPGQRILDACAGRGGKTATIAMVTDNKTEIVAVDRKQNKLDRLKFEFSRQGFSAIIKKVDILKNLNTVKGQFDKVLLDAPCTGTGTMGRRPEIRWKLAPEDVSELVKIQRKMLNEAAKKVTPGGRLVFAVCSVLACEHTGHINSFLKKNSDFSLETEPPGNWPDLISWNRGAPFVNPAISGSDGYGILVFKKQV